MQADNLRLEDLAAIEPAAEEFESNERRLDVLWN